MLKRGEKVSVASGPFHTMADIWTEKGCAGQERDRQLLLWELKRAAIEYMFVTPKT